MRQRLRKLQEEDEEEEEKKIKENGGARGDPTKVNGI